MAEVTRPHVWSDLDGTAVEALSMWNPLQWRRNIGKVDLAPLKGYQELLEGIKSTGAFVAGIVSQRNEFRRNATYRSLAEVGVAFHPTRIIHAGSEEGKAAFIARESKRSAVGLIDDKPHGVGRELLELASQPTTDHSMANGHPIVIGVVPHPEQQLRIEELWYPTRRLFPETRIAQSRTGYVEEIHVRAENLALDVIPIRDYSFGSGVRFGEQVMQASAEV